ncbi:hypothetical protein SAMN05216176_102667, partial [Nitratireductor indicus]
RVALVYGPSIGPYLGRVSHAFFALGVSVMTWSA